MRAVGVDTRDAYMRTPLMVAAAEAGYESVQVLINAGADIDATRGFGGSALQCAAARATRGLHGGPFPSEEDVCKTVAALFSGGLRTATLSSVIMAGGFNQ